MADWFSTPVIVLAAIAAGSLVIGGAYKVGKWVSAIDADRSALKDGANSDREVLTGFMREVRDDIRAIRENILEIFKRLPPAPATVQSDSPLRLTEFGEDIAKDLDAKQWASRVAAGLVGEVEGLEPFEIDEFCARYVREDLTDDWNRRVARCAFDCGIDRPGVLAGLRVALRDALLESLHNA